MREKNVTQDFHSGYRAAEAKEYVIDIINESDGGGRKEHRGRRKRIPVDVPGWARIHKRTRVSSAIHSYYYYKAHNTRYIVAVHTCIIKRISL